MIVIVDDSIQIDTNWGSNGSQSMFVDKFNELNFFEQSSL